MKPCMSVGGKLILSNGAGEWGTALTKVDSWFREGILSSAEPATRNARVR